MPKLQLRTLEEAPSPVHASRAVQEQQRLYDSFIKQLNGNLGELQLDAEENVRSVKVRLRRSATRLGTQLEIWDADGKVYFKTQGQKRRGRPRKGE